ncbi:hypothetical protein LSPH24S_03043 [Lysinibacillus sphaericus]
MYRCLDACYLSYVEAVDLFVLATTSGGIGVVLSGVAAVISQFSDIIPYEEVFHEVADIVKIGCILSCFNDHVCVNYCVATIGCYNTCELLRYMVVLKMKS